MQSRQDRPVRLGGTKPRLLDDRTEWKFESPIPRKRLLEMKVKRIVADIHSPDIALAKCFYQDVLGLDLLMDHGWIATYGSREQMSIQISFASQGGSHTPTPDLSIEVDDVEGALEGMRRAGFPIEYGPADEPWGVRRFYVRDPFGKLVNILAHAESD
jgi:catechol 2,3-dioxygenase-like lactoylglutathione lyase family enzyme